MFPIFLLFNYAVGLVSGKYDPTWESLDTRPLPKWYDEAKIGIFLHWGVFAVPSLNGAAFWLRWKENNPPDVEFMKNNYPPTFTYPDFASKFTAEFFDPDAWAELFEAAGAKYVVLVTKHHEGFTLWPSAHSWIWNAGDLGSRRDIVGQLSSSIRAKTDLHFGVYHSLFEWYNPLYQMDRKNKYTTNIFVESKTKPELYELVENYLPDVIWSDGEWEASEEYWQSKEFLAWLFNESPVNKTVVVNDRWGKGVLCKHGSFFTCTDRYNPKTLQKHKWENAMTLNKDSWGHARNKKVSDYLTIQELLTIMAETVSCGGNLLVNAGPSVDGTIELLMQERLLQMGSWLKINGDAIYGSKPWAYQNDSFTPGVWYTQNHDVFAIILNWPEDEVLLLKDVAMNSKSLIFMLGYRDPLQAYQTSKGLTVNFPQKSKVRSEWSWVLRMKNVNPRKD